MYFRDIETNTKLKREHDRIQKERSAERLKELAKRKKPQK